MAGVVKFHQSREYFENRHYRDCPGKARHVRNKLVTMAGTNKNLTVAADCNRSVWLKCWIGPQPRWTEWIGPPSSPVSARAKPYPISTSRSSKPSTLFLDDIGHWVKFVVVRTDVTPERPHGLSYSLTLHAPDGTRLVGFDNAHPVRERRGPGTRKRGESDHAHRLRATRVYDYKDAATLLEDFWAEVDRILKERGSIP